MKHGRRALVIAVVVCVLLAGCFTFTGGNATPTATTSTDESPAPSDQGPTSTDSSTPTRTSSPTHPATPTPTRTATQTPTATPTPTPTPTGTVSESAATIRMDVLEASTNVSEYHRRANATIRSRANNVKRTVEVTISAAIDRTEQAYRVNTTQSIAGQSVSVSHYLVNATLSRRSKRYVRSYSSQWISFNMSGNVSVAMDVRDTLATYRQSLANATLTVVGPGRVNGITTQVVHADVNETAFKRFANVLEETTIHTVEVRYHINPETDRIVRVNATINQTVTNRVGATVNQRVRTTMDYEYKPVSVSLPSAADNAVQLDGNPYAAFVDNDNGTDSSPPDGSNTSTQSDTANITVKNGSLPKDPDQIFRELQSVAGTNVTKPNRIVILSPSDLSALNRTAPDGGTTFREEVGLVAADAEAVNESILNLTRLGQGFVTAAGNVHVFTADTMDNETIHKVTAHELVHYIQLQQDRHAQLSDTIDLRTTDGIWAYRSVIEGAAVVTTDAYLRAHGPPGVLNSPMYRTVRDALPPGSYERYTNAWYLFGAGYIDARTENVSAIPRVYRTPPTTSEQVLHGLSPSREPPASLSVTVKTGSEWRAVGTDRLGEAFVRYMLENGVSPSRAAVGADGWGNDSLQVFRSTGERANVSFVWTLRWDDAQNASEFATVFGEYLDTYGSRVNGSTVVNNNTVTVERPTDRTVVVTLGTESFVDTVEVTTEGDTVVIQTDA